MVDPVLRGPDPAGFSDLPGRGISPVLAGLVQARFYVLPGRRRLRQGKREARLKALSTSRIENPAGSGPGRTGLLIPALDDQN